MAWLHPVSGVLAVLLVAWMAMAGLRARQRDPLAPESRRLHARYAPVAAAVVSLAALSGPASTALLRDDIAFASTPHFVLGMITLALALLTALTSRQLPRTRKIHPVLGLALLAACVGQALLGLGMLP